MGLQAHPAGCSPAATTAVPNEPSASDEAGPKPKETTQPAASQDDARTSAPPSEDAPPAQDAPLRKEAPPPIPEEAPQQQPPASQSGGDSLLDRPHSQHPMPESSVNQLAYSAGSPRPGDSLSAGNSQAGLLAFCPHACLIGAVCLLSSTWPPLSQGCSSCEVQTHDARKSFSHCSR